MVGAALVRRFRSITEVEVIAPNRSELDLADQRAVFEFYSRHRPDAAIIAAGKVGGIHANNTYPVEFLQQNLAIAMHCIEGAHRVGVKRLLYLGSSCIYPKHAPQPMKEEHLLTGSLEPTNEGYAIAKIAGIKLAQYYRRQYGDLFYSAMPTNLYGPGDQYHPENSHVLPALIRRFHLAKLAADPVVTAWGTGSPLREFMHVDDLAEACALLMDQESPPDWINVGSGSEVTIKELVEIVAKAVGYCGVIRWDESKPDGAPRKLMDSTKLNALGWRPHYDLKSGIRHAYACFLAEMEAGTLRLV